MPEEFSKSMDPLEKLFTALRCSKWGETLQVDGIDLLEASRAIFYDYLLNFPHRVTSSKDQGDFTGFSLEKISQKWIRERSNFLAYCFSTTPHQADVLFLPREPSHVLVQVPVAKILKQNGISYQFVTNAPLVFSDLFRVKERAIYWPAVLKKFLPQQSLIFQNNIKVLDENPGIELPLPNEWVMSQEDFCSSMRAFLKKQRLLLAKSVFAIEGLMDVCHPKVLVIGNDLTPEGRIACFTAKKRSIPTVMPMHGAITSDPVHQFHLADRIFAFGLMAKEQLIKMNFPENKIEVTGSPHLDSMPSQTGEINPRLKRKCRLTQGNPWVLVATSGPGHSVSFEHHQVIIKNLIRLASERRDILFLVKLHKKDQQRWYQEELQKTSISNFKILSYGTRGVPFRIYDWLQGCPLVLTTASTVAPEAILMDVPVITMDFMNAFQGIDFIDQKVTTHAQTYEELKRSVDKVLSKKPYDETLLDRVRVFKEGYFYKRDGKASERIAISIQRIIKNNQN